MSARCVARVFRSAVVVSSLLLAPLAVQAQAARAARAAIIGKETPVIYMEITPRSGAAFRGDGLTVKSAKASDIVVHSLDFDVSQSIVDPRTGDIIVQKAKYKPLVITHDVGPSTVQILNASAHDEMLPKVVITFWKQSRDRNNAVGEAKDYSLELQDVRIVSVRQYTEESRLLEEVAFVFRKITATYANGGFTFTDDAMR